MAGAIRKTMVYLGLSEPEPGYDASAAEGEEMESEHYDALDYAVEHTYAPAEVTPLHAEGSLQRIKAVHPTTYNAAKQIGEAFREGTPVIMNLTKMTDAEAKRIVDFAAGLAFGLHGSIERVTNMVFLLSPASVEVQSETPEPSVTGARFFDQN